MWTFDILPDYAKQWRIVRSSRGQYTTPVVARYKASSQNMAQRPKFIDVWLDASSHGGEYEEHHVRLMRHGAVAFVDCPRGSIGQQRMMMLLGLGDDAQCQHCMGLLYGLAEGYSYMYGPVGGAFIQDWRRMMDGSMVRGGLGRMPGHRDLLRQRGAIPNHRRDGFVPCTKDEARTNRHARNLRRDEHAAWQPGRPSVHAYGLSTQAMLRQAIEHCHTLDMFKPHRIVTGITDGLHAEAWATGKGWGNKPKHLKAMVPVAWRYLHMRGLSMINGHLVGAIAGMRNGQLEAWCLKVNTPYGNTDWHLATFDMLGERDGGGWRFCDWRKGYSWRQVMAAKTKTHQAVLAQMLRPDGSLRVMPDGFSLHNTIVRGAR